MRRVMATAVVAAGVMIAFLWLTGVWMARRFEAHSERPRVTEAGRRRGPARAPRDAGADLTPEQERELERIAGLGYIAGREPASDRTGVVRSLADSVYPGYTLYTCAEGTDAYLIDMEGRTVFRWSAPGAKYWARAHAFPSGDLLVVTSDPYRLMKLNSRSEVLWIYGKPAHHDFDVLSNGVICVLVREATKRDDIHSGSLILDDAIALVDPDGRELARISILDAFANSPTYARWLDETGLPDGPDVLHTNSVQVLNQSGRARALLSIRAINTVALLDLMSRQIVWARRGPWRMQHEAMLVGGHLLVFDNLGLEGQSRVLEFDGLDGDVVWSYTEEGFLTEGVGAQQRLPNGNTLITESEKGRIIEVTSGGTVVWEYINPETTADDARTTLGIMRAERIPADFPLDWSADLEG